MITEEIRARPRVGGTENVVRYAGGSHFDPSTGILNGSAFDRAPKDTDGLSVTRRAVLAVNPDDDEARIRDVMASRMKLGRAARFIEINVQVMLDALSEFEQEVFACEDPLPEDGEELANPAHALVAGLPFAGEAIGSLRSELVGDRLRQLVSHMFPAVLTS